MQCTLTFPGQGSQAIGMGFNFYQDFAVARNVFQEVDDALNEKLSTLIFSGTTEELTLTQNAQPALMAVSMAIVRVLEHELGHPIFQKTAFMAGHSLGEYTAYCASGAFNITDTARLLRTRGTAMQAATPVGVGSMAAILGLDIEDVEQIATQAQQGDVCVVANDNSPGQIVISGHKEAVDRACQLALDHGAKRALLLPVSAPFHSPLMAYAADVMRDALDQTTMIDIKCPVISNVTTAPTQDTALAKDLLVAQVMGRVRWRESMASLPALDITHVIEIGAGKVLTGLSKRITPDLCTMTVNNPSDITSVLTLLS